MTDKVREVVRVHDVQRASHSDLRSLIRGEPPTSSIIRTIEAFNRSLAERASMAHSLRRAGEQCEANR